MMVSSASCPVAYACSSRGTTPIKLSFARTSTKAPASRLDELCLVSYGVASSNSTAHRPMPAAARAAFKALERDSSIAIARSRVALTATTAAAAEASAIDTLCLVTYSDDEDASASWQQQQQQLGRVQRALLTGKAGAAAGKASAVFAALCSEDHTTGEGDGLPEVLETLCILSYDEEAS